MSSYINEFKSSLFQNQEDGFKIWGVSNIIIKVYISITEK